jgi:hypothetical protein
LVFKKKGCLIIFIVFQYVIFTILQYFGNNYLIFFWKFIIIINVIVFWASRCFKFRLICVLNSTWDFKKKLIIIFHLIQNSKWTSFVFFISFFFAIILFSNYLLYALSCLEIVENINNIITFVYRFKIIVPYWSPIFAIICLLFLFQTWIGHSKYLNI